MVAVVNMYKALGGGWRSQPEAVELQTDSPGIEGDDAKETQQSVGIEDDP